MITVGVFLCLNTAAVTVDVICGAALNESLWSHSTVPVLVTEVGGGNTGRDGGFCYPCKWCDSGAGPIVIRHVCFPTTREYAYHLMTYHRVRVPLINDNGQELCGGAKPVKCPIPHLRGL